MRELSTHPFFNTNLDTNYLQIWREQNYRVYLNWTPLDNVALSLNYNMDKFTTNLDPLDSFRKSFPDTDTHMVGASARYFHNSGFFLQLNPMLVHQNVVGINPENEDTTIDQSRTFFLLDSTLGYRLPRRLGIIKFQVKNILNEQFDYQNEWWRSNNRELTPQFYPARTFIGNIIISF